MLYMCIAKRLPVPRIYKLKKLENWGPLLAWDKFILCSGEKISKCIIKITE
jgi:hypothetical protein